MLTIELSVICCNNPDPVLVHGPRYSSLWCAECESDLTTDNVTVEAAYRQTPREDKPIQEREA